MATITFKEAKKGEFEEYVSEMTLNTPIQRVYEKLRKIRGRPARRISILKSNGHVYSTTQEIAECLAGTFAQVLRRTNYKPEFLLRKEREERIKINFESNNEEEYNDLFSLTEMEAALNTTKTQDQSQTKYIKIC